MKEKTPFSQAKRNIYPQKLYTPAINTKKTSPSRIMGKNKSQQLDTQDHFELGRCRICRSNFQEKWHKSNGRRKVSLIINQHGQLQPVGDVLIKSMKLEI